MSDDFDQSQDAIELPRRLGNYELTELLGRGGMGEVYLAYNIELKEPAAVRLLPKRLAEDASFVSRFREEARKLRRLVHPNIVQTHDFGRDGDDFYLVMEQIDGGNLQDVIDQRPDGIGPDQVQRYMLQIAAAAKEAHDKTVHRSLSPNNILLTKDGRVKVSDFGLAEMVGEEFTLSLIQKSVTRSQVGVAETLPTENSDPTPSIEGKVRYMSPQVARGEPPDTRNDIYALGIMLHDMLTGHATGKIRSIAKEKPELDPRWQKIFDKCAADDIGRRYQSVGELESDLRALSFKAGKGSHWGKIAALLALAGVGIAAYCYRAEWLPKAEQYAQEREEQVNQSDAPPSNDDSGEAPSQPPKPAAQNNPLPVGLQMAAALPEGSVLTLLNPKPEGVPTRFADPASVQLPLSESGYTLRFDHPDYQPVTFTLPGHAGSHRVSFKLAQLRLTRNYTIDSVPQGAEVLADGKPIGVTPLSQRLSLSRVDENLPYQPLPLTLNLQGYESAELLLSEDTPTQVPAVPLRTRAQGAPSKLQITLPGGVQLDLAYIEAGVATLGSPDSEEGRIAHAETLQQIEIDRPFYIGIYETTQAQYRALTGANPSFYLGGQKPVEQVTYRELTDEDGYLQKLTTHLQANNYAGWVADLPTNAEWEYATRAGTLTTFYNGEDITSRGRDPALDELAVYFTVMTAPVGTKTPNPWGLYDTLGNVFEWTKEGDLRGGSFKQQATTTRPAYRLIGKTDRARTDKDANQFGFRVVLRPPNR